MLDITSRSYYVIQNKKPLKQYESRYHAKCYTRQKVADILPIEKAIVYDGTNYSWRYYNASHGCYVYHHINKLPPKDIMEKYDIQRIYERLQVTVIL